MNKRSLIVISTIMTIFAGTATAQDPIVNESHVYNQLIPTSIRVEAGSVGYGGAENWTANFGGAITWTANPYIDVSLGYNGSDISTRDDILVGGVPYDVNTKINTTYLNAEIHPWGTSESKFAKSLYVAAGAAYIDNDINVTKPFTAGTIQILGIDFSYNGVVRGKTSYNNTFAPYFGGGFSSKVTDRIGVFGEVGAYYTQNPKVKLDLQGTLVNSAGGNTEIDVRTIESGLQIYEKYSSILLENVNSVGGNAESDLRLLENEIANDEKFARELIPTSEKMVSDNVEQDLRLLENEMNNYEKYASALLAATVYVARGNDELDLREIENELSNYEKRAAILKESTKTAGSNTTREDLRTLENKIRNAKQDLNTVVNKVRNAEQKFRAVQAEIHNDDKYSWILVAKLGISYHF